MIVYFIPAVGHLIAQSEPHGEIRFQLDFILEVHGGFKRSERQRLRIHRRQKVRWSVLQEFQMALVTDATGVILYRGERGLAKALEPRTHAQVVAAARHLQIVGPGIVPPLIVVKVLAIGRHKGARCIRRLSASEDDRAWGAPTLAAHEEQAGRKRLEG